MNMNENVKGHQSAPAVGGGREEQPVVLHAGFPRRGGSPPAAVSDSTLVSDERRPSFFVRMSFQSGLISINPNKNFGTERTFNVNAKWRIFHLQAFQLGFLRREKRPISLTERQRDRGKRCYIATTPMDRRDPHCERALGARGRGRSISRGSTSVPSAPLASSPDGTGYGIPHLAAGRSETRTCG